jgi:hypothetical protein
MKKSPNHQIRGRIRHKNDMFLSSGLYRRSGIRTLSAKWLADLWLSPITAGEELHLALKQTIKFMRYLPPPWAGKIPETIIAC